jgi:hypothetical protein
MAAMDFTALPYGWICGGTGVDATEVTTKQVRVKAFIFTPNAAAATCVIKDVAATSGTTARQTFSMLATTGDTIEQYFGENGAPFDGLNVDLGHANDRLYIILA